MVRRNSQLGPMWHWHGGLYMSAWNIRFPCISGVAACIQINAEGYSWVLPADTRCRPFIGEVRALSHPRLVQTPGAQQIVVLTSKRGRPAGAACGGPTVLNYCPWRKWPCFRDWQKKSRSAAVVHCPQPAHLPIHRSSLAPQTCPFPVYPRAHLGILLAPLCLTLVSPPLSVPLCVSLLSSW